MRCTGRSLHTELRCLRLLPPLLTTNTTSSLPRCKRPGQQITKHNPHWHRTTHIQIDSHPDCRVYNTPNNEAQFTCICPSQTPMTKHSLHHFATSMLRTQPTLSIGHNCTVQSLHLSCLSLYSKRTAGFRPTPLTSTQPLSASPQSSASKQSLPQSSSWPL